MAIRVVDIEEDGAKPKPSNIKTALIGFGQGLTMENFDELVGGASVPLALIGQGAGSYKGGRDYARALDKAAASENPYVYYPAYVAGAALPAALSFGASGLPQATSAMGRVGAAARAGIVPGAITGFGAATGDLTNTAISTGVGGLTGFAGGGLLGGVMEGGRALINRLRPGSINRAANEIVTGGLLSDALTPEELAANAAQMQSLGKPAVLADIGGDKIRDTVTAVGQSPGRGYRIMQDVLEPRGRAQIGRVTENIDEAFGGQGNFFQNFDEAVKARSAAAGPAYRAAYEAPVNLDLPEIRQLLRQMPDEAFTRAQKIADIRQYGQDVAGMAGADNVVLNTEGADLITRGLRDYTDEAFRAGRGELGAASKDILNRFKSLTEEANPLLAEARKQYAGSTRALELMEEGRGFLNKSPADVAYTVQQIGEGNLPFYRMGAREQLLTSAAKVPESGNAARGIATIPAKRGNIEAVIGDAEKANRFIEQSLAEDILSKTEQALSRGQQTGLGFARMAEIEGSAANNLTKANIINRAINAVTQNPARTAAINEQVATRLMTPASQLDDLLSMYERQMAVERARQAQALIGGYAASRAVSPQLGYTQGLPYAY